MLTAAVFNHCEIDEVKLKVMVSSYIAFVRTPHSHMTGHGKGGCKVPAPLPRIG